MLPQTLGTYVYFETLRDVDPTFAADAAAYSTFNPSTSLSASGEAIEPIRAAISTLKNIAATQAQKEHQAIHNYLIKINKHLANKNLPAELKRNLRAQREKIQNLDFANCTTDSLDLIQAINGISQNLNSYERRLRQISMPATQSWQLNSRMEFHIQERLEKFFENRGKKTTGTQIEKDKQLHALMDKQISKQCERGMPKEFANELKALLFIDFNNWVENVAYSKSSYTTLTKDDVVVLYNEYLQKQEDSLQQTHLQRMLMDSNDELQGLLTDMQNMWHSDIVSAKEIKELKQDIAKVKNPKKETIKFHGSSLSVRQAQNLVDTYNYGLTEGNKGRFVFTLHTATSHGNFYEHISTILKSAINIEGNVAADLLIPIGTATFTQQEQQEQKALMNLGREMEQVLTEDFNKRQQISIETFNEAVAAERTLSDKLATKMNEARDSLEELSDLNEQFFIAHESTKLYASAETENSTIKDFHGRKMNILGALAKLYASPTIANSMIDPNMLITYLINISNVTLAGGANKPALETYISLFAGLLMFDDIKALAEVGVESIQNNLQSTTLDALHVYNIGGVYMPISVILNDMVNQMDDILAGMSINSDKTAVAVIKGPTPEAPEHGGLDAWSAVANSTIQGTTIQIHFLAGFTKYVQQLLANFTT